MAAETISFRTVDWCHVEGPAPADAADVNREVKAIAIRGFNQGAQRSRVGRSIDQFDEFFVLELIDDAKQLIWPLGKARWRERSRPMGIGEPVGKRRLGLGRRSRAVLPEEASDKKS